MDIGIYIYVIQIQRIIAVIGILAFYDALKKIIKNHAAALIFTFFDAIAIGIWGYTDVIMTESLGISIMCLCVWSVMRLIVSKKKKYIVFSSILAMIGIWTRPSFIFIIPVLLLFFVIYGLYEKDRKGFILGTGSIAVCGILLFAYCKNNERLTGAFMLSSVSYHNQLAIMLKGNLYVNDDYPDITQEAVERAQHPQYSLKDATDMCDLFGYARIAEYLRSCRKLYSKEYALYILKTNALYWLDEPVIEERVPEDIFVRKLFEILRVLTIPYNYGLLFIVTILELLYGVGKLIKDKYLDYMSFGIPGCILAILTVSVISLEDDALSRLSICVIPLSIMLTAMLFVQIHHYLIKYVTEKE